MAKHYLTAEESLARWKRLIFGKTALDSLRGIREVVESKSRSKLAPEALRKIAAIERGLVNGTGIDQLFPHLIGLGQTMARMRPVRTKRKQKTARLPQHVINDLRQWKRELPNNLSGRGARIRLAAKLFKVHGIERKAESLRSYRL